MRPFRSEYLRANLVVGASSLVRVALSLFKTKASAVFLGPAGLGIIGIANQLQLLCLSVGSLSIGSGFLQIFSKSNSESTLQEKKELLKTSFTLLIAANLVLVIFAGAILLAFPKILGESFPANFALPVLLSVPFGVFAASYFQGVLYGHGRFDYWSKANAVLGVVDAILFVSLIWLFGSIGALWAMFLSMFFLAAANLYFCLKLENWKTLFSFGLRFAIAKSLAKFGFTAFLTSIFAYTFGIFVRVWILRFLNEESNGGFQAIMVLSGFSSQLIANGIWAQLFPLMSSSAAEEEKKKAWLDSLITIAWLAGLTVLAVLLSPSWILRILFNEQFANFAKIFPFVVLGDFFFLLAQPTLAVLLAGRSLRKYLVGWSIYYGLALGLAFYLLPRIGLLGAAIAILVSGVFLFLFSCLELEQKKVMKSRFIAIFVLSLLAIALQLFLWWNLGDSLLGIISRIFLFGAYLLVAGLNISFVEGGAMEDLSLKTNFLNLIRKIWTLPGAEPLAVKISENLKGNPYFFRALANHYQYPKPSIRHCVRKGISYELDVADFIDWHIYFGYSEGAKQALYALNRPGQCVLDIGGNIGETALEMAKRVGSSGRVYCFEPDPLMIQKLQKNLSMNPKLPVELVPLAAGRERSHLQLLRADERNPAGNRIGTIADDNTVAIESISIDEFVQTRNISVDLIKIDVEGFEKQVLLGAERTLEKFHPVLFVEISDVQLRRQGTSALEVLNILKAKGYEITYAHSGLPVALEALEGPHFDVVAKYFSPKR